MDRGQRPAIGIVTIGQSPRDDMVPEMAPHWPGFEVRQGGALDDLSDEEIHRLSKTGDEVLTSRLRSGGSAVFTRQAILPGVQRRITELEDSGVVATLLVCTGSFPPLRHTRPLLAAEPLLVAATGGLAAGGRIGVICPLAAQRESSVTKFRPVSRGEGGVVSATADPYGDGPEEFAAAGRQLRTEAAELMVLDCMGYTEQQRRWVAAAVDVPVVLARSVVARLVGELIAGMAVAGS